MALFKEKADMTFPTDLCFRNNTGGNVTLIPPDFINP